MSTLRILPIDVGWAYRLTDGPTRLVLASKAKEDNWPPDSMLSLKGKKGIMGFLKQDDPKLVEYENEAVDLVAQNLDDRTLIVLPEFSGSPSIEKRIRELLDKSLKKCIVVAGSYYRDNKGRVECVCPVLVPGAGTYYQHKFAPAKIEKPGFDRIERPTLLVFQHTGFGDFAVLICSDALDHTAQQTYVDGLRQHIDFLVVPSRNHADRLRQGLQSLADEERWHVLYCNGDKSLPSAILTPYRRASPKCPKVNGCTAEIDLRQFQRDLDEDLGPHRKQAEDRDLHTLADDRIFSPAPRHWPFRGYGAIDLSDHLRVVAVGSHFDDVWLGCSGTLMRLRECYNAQIHVVTMCKVYPFDYFGRYEIEGTTLTDLKKDLSNLCDALGFQHESPEATFVDQSFEETAVRAYMKELSRRACHTDILFIPRHDDDPHRDHRVTAKVALTEFRGANVFEYEIKDFRRRPFNPNVLVDLSIRSNQNLELHGEEGPQSMTFAEKKLFILKNAFRMIDKTDLPLPFQPEHSLGRMAFRASQSGTELRYAEAFIAEMII